MKSHWLFRLLKAVLRVGLAIAFPDAKPEARNIHEAQQMYDEGLIGDSELVRSKQWH